MNKKSKIKIFKVILTILVLFIFIGVIVYLFPVMKNLSTTEGQIAFKEKVEDSGFLGLLSLFGLQVAQIFLIIVPRRAYRNISRYVLWWLMGNSIYNGISRYNINSHILIS